jgi:hypothetical protein
MVGDSNATENELRNFSKYEIKIPPDETGGICQGIIGGGQIAPN